MSRAPEFNSVRCAIVDGSGDEHCVTFAGLDYADRFRTYAVEMARYWRTRQARVAYARTARGAPPSGPFRVSIEPYHDAGPARAPRGRSGRG